MQIGSSPDGPSLSLKYLARIFNFLDGDIIACWNGRCLRSACKTLTPERTVYILSRLSGTTAEVFGDEDGLHQLSEVQKADLLVTWQWIRNRIWHLAHLHGLTGEDRAKELGFGYPVEVALTTVAICKRLSIPSMEAHGTGFVSCSVIPQAATLLIDLDRSRSCTISRRPSRSCCSRGIRSRASWRAWHAQISGQSSCRTCTCSSVGTERGIHSRYRSRRQWLLCPRGGCA